jgi:hypothetical protein
VDVRPETCPGSPVQKLTIPPTGDTNLSFQTGVYILNEGTFTFGNASISYYNPETKEVIQDVFYKVNGRLIGDVLQSAIIDEDQIWWVINNSQKVERTTKNSLKSKAVYAGFSSPRYALIDDGDLIVTELYGAGIWKLDTSMGCIEQNYPTGGWTEFLVVRSTF